MSNEHLPEQLRKQIAEADRLTAEMTAPKPPAKPQQPQPTPQEHPEPQADGAEIERLKHSLSVLQGKYNAELPRAIEQARTLAATLEERDRELAALREAAKAPPVDEGAAELEELKKALGPQAVEELGEEFLKTQATIARIVSGRQVRGQMTAIDRKVQETAQASAEQARQRFYEHLTALVPDWETVNTSDAWKEWLGQNDELSATPRQALLNAAFAEGTVTGRADQVARFFRLFGAGQTTEQRQTVRTPTVSPGRQASVTPAAKKVYTRDELTRLRDDCLKGRYPQADRDRIMNEVVAAYAEGRVSG
jgi:hypothetical protein